MEKQTYHTPLGQPYTIDDFKVGDKIKLYKTWDDPSIIDIMLVDYKPSISAISKENDCIYFIRPIDYVPHLWNIINAIPSKYLDELGNEVIRSGCGNVTHIHRPEETIPSEPDYTKYLFHTPCGTFHWGQEVEVSDDGDDDDDWAIDNFYGYREGNFPYVCRRSLWHYIRPLSPIRKELAEKEERAKQLREELDSLEREIQELNGKV